MKYYFIRTYGCQMNALDSEVMAGILERRGLVPCSDETQADLIIYNTCSVRDLAERKALGKLGRLSRSFKKRRPIIGITGCMAASKKEALFSKTDFLDFVLGTNNIHDLDTILDQLSTQNRLTKVDPLFHQELDYSLAKRQDPFKALVSISRGCNNFCTYCIVPYTRGREVSRPLPDIVDECKRLADTGYQEITLLGQNVNSWGNDKPEWNQTFPDLLSKIATETSIKRIRFMTSHPKDISDDLISCFTTIPQLCPFLHFPLQSGSDTILRRMNRGYTLSQYLEKVAKLRATIPTIAIGTDIIVGFPGETEADFQLTFQAMKDINFSQSFIFAYSPRKNTPAMRFNDIIPTTIKNHRIGLLLELQNFLTTAHLTTLLNTQLPVLVEEQSSKNKAFLKGRTPHFYTVVFEGHPSLIGTIQTITINSVSNQTLIGSLNNSKAENRFEVQI